MKHSRVLEVLLAVTSTLVAAALLWNDRAPLPAPPRAEPRPNYLGSAGCQMCHPSEYASWHRTFHRTMTRRTRDLSWDGQDGPTLPAQLEDRYFSFELSRRGDQVVARGPDLHLAAQLLYEAGEQARQSGDLVPSEAAIERALEQVPRVERPVVLATGSHHYLGLWLAADGDRELRQLPFVYHLREAQWAPRSQAFLEPPQSPPYIATWNSNCIQCHVVAGEPQETEWQGERGALHVRYQSRVAELGIACEACHGPGRAHADHYRSPLSRAGFGASDRDMTLVNPAELESATGSAICGQCHAYFVPKDVAEFWEFGFARSFSPGQTLDHSRQLLVADGAAGETASISRELGSIFWPDGTIRVGGREYNGLVESACYLQGSGERKLGCMSCHSMHDSDADDQLLPEVRADPDTPCRACHADTAPHSGHPSGSLGSSCVDCHMPKTSYALLKGIRSHRIQIPNPKRVDVPSACALCHVDRPPSWYSRGAARAADEADLDPVGVGVRAALSGNAAERAIYAAALGSAETVRTAGEPLVRRLLQVLAQDPYHAVRRIAERGLSGLPPAGPNASAPPLDERLLRELQAARDNRDIVISE